MCVVQAGSAMGDNYRDFFLRAQFLSVLHDILTVLLDAPYKNVSLRILAKNAFSQNG
jgi:hypothetical protein